MKIMQLAVVAAVWTSLATAQAGDVAIKGVHLCCGACVKDADAALKDVKGVTDVGIDRNTKTITFKTEDEKAAKAGIEALADAGFHGTATLDKKELAFPQSGAEKGKKVSSLLIEGVHLCCGACVTGVQEALKDVKGASNIDVDRSARTVKISGADIDPAAAVAALNKAGFHGTVEKEKK